MSILNPNIDYQRSVDRYRFLTILNAAHQCDEYVFAKQAAMLWLTSYPGDLYVKYYQAKTLVKSGKKQQGKMMYDSLIELDPVFVEPLKDLSELSTLKDIKQQYKTTYQYLINANPHDDIQGTWLAPLWKAREKYEKGEYLAANQFIHDSILKNPPTPIPAILHLKIANKLGNQEMLNNLSDIYFESWPKCLQINVIKALAEMEQGHESTAVERLHWVEANDNAGQVITQLMGNDHRFKDLWPERMEVYFDLPIPAAVSAFLGWNQLYSGLVNIPEFKQQPIRPSTHQTNPINNLQEVILSHSAPESQSKKNPDRKEIKSKLFGKKRSEKEEYDEIQNAFSKIANRLKKLDLERRDNRFPVYVILSSKKQLEKIYGPNTADVIDNLLKDLIGNIQRMPDWDGKIFYPDDSAAMTRMGLKPIIASDAWQIKLALGDLDDYLEKHGEMIGALLIVGGPEIVPYHHLPNPTNDNDLDVPSDNPYSTIDENYFIPQWPVGRLPGETGADAGLLLSQIRSLIYQYEKKGKKAKTTGFNFASLITRILDFLTQWNRNLDTSKSFGYSAEIWKDASKEVYKSATQDANLQLSPPVHSGSLSLNNGVGHNIGYFNLHGIKEGPNWYGQKDFASESSGPDYPIALSPEMFNEKIRSPKLVFTEACYGANIIDKQHEEAISLKFLDSGTKTFVGSTCTAYGSVMPPLIAADFLAERFWRLILEGQAAGYALMQAKLGLVEEMTRIQGFLDGEDQKTILSFILLGDPLAVFDGLNIMPKPLFREKSHPTVKTISDSDMKSENGSGEMPLNVSEQVEKIVKNYLPGLQNAQMKMSKSFNAPDSPNRAAANDSQRYIVTLQKSIDLNHHTAHHHYARITFNDKGKLVKFTTSR
jgi:hypothetical protein